jgi:enterochelin esterase-like enzyme
VGLTGGVFLSLVAGLTVVAFAVVVVYWPKLSGRSPLRIAGRVGALLLVNLLVLLTAATQLNATYLFFASWVDLKGAFTGTITQTALDRGGSAKEATQTHVHGAAAHAHVIHMHLTHKESRGVITFHVHGRLSGVNGQIVVQVPPGYTKPSNAKTKYPVLEAFTGYPGAPLGWFANMHIAEHLSDAVKAHHIRYPIVVSPQIEIPNGVDTECVNGKPGNPQIETWLTRDVPNWIATHFRVHTNRESWATIGLSAGGWCAAMASILHPAQYGAAIVLGGYFRPQMGPYYTPYPEKSRLAQRYDLPAYIRRHPPPLAMWLETSHADPVSYSTSASLLTHARSPMTVHAVVLQHAGHRLGLWEALLPEAFRWLGATEPGFRWPRPGSL